MKLASRVMDNTLAYRVWMAPFADRKFGPILRHNDMRRVRRVLDVGCGPGTNTPYFTGADYLGIDFNAKYIENARRRHKREFIVADVTKYTAQPGAEFDFVLANSLFHHIATDDARRILAPLATLLSTDECIHIMHLVFP